MRLSELLIPIAALAVAGGAVTASAVAADGDIPAPAAVTQAPEAEATLTPAQSAALAKDRRRARYLAKYGMFPLPVSERAILKWRLTRRDLRSIAAARRLAESPKGRSVRWCESNGEYRLSDGAYFGAWQFDRQTWLANGGGRFGSTANRAPRWAQDLIMWKTQKAYGWGPWTCA